MTAIRKAAVKWLALALVASACTAPPAVVPSKTPEPAKLTVVAAGADGPDRPKKAEN